MTPYQREHECPYCKAVVQHNHADKHLSACRREAIRAFNKAKALEAARQFVGAGVEYGGDE